MKFDGVIASLVAGCVTLCCTHQATHAFQPSIFNGAGIRIAQQPEVEEASAKTKPVFPKLFSKDAADESWFGRPPQFPTWNPFTARHQFDEEMELSERPNAFQGLPRLFPERDPEQPNVLQQWNQKSKDFLAQRRQSFDEWASRTNESMRSRTTNTWENMTKGFKSHSAPAGAAGPFEWLRPKSAQQPPAQPPIRSAQIPQDSPKIKF